MTADRRHLANFVIGFCALAAALATPAAATPPRFAAPFLAYPASFGSQAVITLDANEDGHPDVVTVSATGTEVRLGIGDGTLGPSAKFVGGSSPFLVSGDLNQDGHADLVMGGDSVSVVVELGFGDGTFGPATKFAVTKSPVVVVLADFDGDGKLDLASLSSRASTVTVRLGLGDGTFAPGSDVFVGGTPVGLAVGLLDGDAHPDLLVAQTLPAQLTPLIGDGAGGFTGATPTPLPAGGPLVLADLDGDTRLDAIVSVRSFLQAFVLRGLSGAGFGAPVTLSLPGACTAAAAVGDLDGDHIPDLVFTLNDHSDGVTLLGHGDATFGAPQMFGTARSPSAVALADMNGGGKLDAVVTGSFTTVSVHMGNGDGTFGGRRDAAAGMFPSAVATGDLDRDGHVDVVIPNSGDATVSVLLGHGDGTFEPKHDLAAGQGPTGVALADVNLDSKLDIVVSNFGPGTQTSSTVSVFLGNGAGSFAPRIDIGVGRWPVAVAVGDLDGDGVPDMAVAENDFVETLSILHGMGNGQFGNRQGFAFGSNATAVEIGDATGDGHPDIVLTTWYPTGNVFVLPGHGDGSYAPEFGMATPANANGIGLADVTGDGRPDVVVGNSGLSVFPELAGGGFGPRVDFAAGGGPLALGDLDADGVTDAVTANSSNSNSLSVLSSAPGGVFANRVDYGAGEAPVAVALADFDEDGRPDIVTANTHSNNASILLNTGGLAWLPWLGVPRGSAGLALALAARPNPARDVLTLEFALREPGPATVRVYDVAGRQLGATLTLSASAGTNRVRWQRPAAAGGRAIAGVCFAEVTAGGQRAVRRVVLLP